MNTPTSQPNPYAPPTAAVSDAPPGGESYEPADRGTRFGAAMLDGVIYILLCVPIFIGMVVSPGAGMDLNMALGVGGLLTLVAVIGWAIYTIYLVKRNGQTIGKKLLGIKVVRSDGSPASLGRIFWLRNIVNAIPGALPFVGYVYSLVDHLLIFSEKRQCLHDKIADTIVVRA
jgi:uncharacterized RDD family membrane protein YckC